MREIKFRAWDTINQKMHFDDLETFEFARNGEPVMCCVGGFSKPLSAKSSISHGQLILQQYTGLKDRNGKEIWEEDVFDCENGRGIVKYRNGGYYLDWIGPKLFGSRSDLYHNAHEGEVIGNIHQNPELLPKED